MQKGFAPILIVIGILVITVVAGGVYFIGKSQTPKPQVQNPVVSQTSQPTIIPSSAPDETANPDLIGANWKTYQLTKTYRRANLEFSILYPNNWQVKTGTENVRWFTKNVGDYSLEILWWNPDVVYDRIDTCEGNSCKKIGNIVTAEGIVIEIWQLDEIVRIDRNLPNSFLHASATITNSEKRVLPEFNTMALSLADFKKILSTFKFLP